MALIRSNLKGGGSPVTTATSSFGGNVTSGSVTAAHDGMIILIGNKLSTATKNGASVTLAGTIRVLAESPYNAFWGGIPVSSGDVIAWTATDPSGVSYIEIY